MSAKKLFKIFEGLGRGHGYYRLKGTSIKGKKHDGAAETIHEPATVKHWEMHLKGEYGLGIVPIRDDGTCVFGSIDIDAYQNFEIKELEKIITKAELPLVCCTTKSGGAHLYLFCNESVPAVLIRKKLMEWAVFLGYSGVEVFPKQVQLAGSNDYGNWINMPYFQGDKSNRYAIAAGKKLNIKDFLKLVEILSLDESELSETNPPEDKTQTTLLLESPPCLKALAKRGINEGARNNGMFNYGVYLRKRFGDTWEENFDELNNEFFHPPLASKEVQRLVLAVNKKKYNYRCNEEPIVSVCNKQICLSCQFGVGDVEGDPGVAFGQLVKINTRPPIWIWDVDGYRVELSSAELSSQKSFRIKFMEVATRLPNALKPKEYDAYVAKALIDAEIVQAPADASTSGAIWIELQNYLTNGNESASKEELAKTNRPYREDGYIMFSGTDFLKELQAQRIQFTPHRVWSLLREKGVKHLLNQRIAGKQRSYWLIPEFDEKEEDLEAITPLEGGEEDKM